MYKNLTPAEVKQKLDNKDIFRFVDVREAEELEICKLDEAEHFPMSEITKNTDKFNQDIEIVFFCHHGIRSAQVADFFIKKGFKNVKNMSGGIDLWSDTIDNKIAKY